VADADGNTYGPYDIEVAGSESEPLSEAAWYLIHQESGVVSGGGLTFAGLTATLDPIHVHSHGSFLVREDPWSDASPATTGASPRRDMLVARRQLTVGEGGDAIPGKTFLTVLRGTPAATPAEPTFDPVNDELLWSWQVPASGGTVVTDVRDYRRAPGDPKGIELASTVAGLVVPPNTSSPTAFTTANVIGLDRYGYLQAGNGDQLKVPVGMGGVHGIAWGGALGAVPAGRHFWDLSTVGSRNVARRANAYADDTVSGYTELRLADGDIIRFRIQVLGSGPSSGNWPVASRFLSCFRLGG
jgi:hypothetical protein